MKTIIIISLTICLLCSNSIAAPVDDSSIESFLGLSSGTLDSISTGDATEGSAIKGTFNIQEGETFSFDYIWDSDEIMGTPFNDFAFFSLSMDGVGVLADTFARDNDSGRFLWTASSSGELTFGIGIMDVKDYIVGSYLDVRNISNANDTITGIGEFVANDDGSYFLSTGGSNDIPLPPAIVLLFSGLVCLKFYRKENNTINKAT